MKKLILSLLLLSSASAYGIAGSLYKVESTPFASFIARDQGDLLTVIVDEWSDTTDSGERKHNRKTEADFNLTKLFFPDLHIEKGFVDSESGGSTPGLSWNNELKSEASAENKSGHTFETKLEVRLVEEVRPGQFIIRGHRRVNINGKDKTIFLSGVVRQRDITPFNTIRSHQIADAHVEIEGEVGGTDVREGLINKVFNFIF